MRVQEPAANEDVAKALRRLRQVTPPQEEVMGGEGCPAQGGSTSDVHQPGASIGFSSLRGGGSDGDRLSRVIGQHMDALDDDINEMRKIISQGEAARAAKLAIFRILLVKKVMQQMDTCVARTDRQVESGQFVSNTGVRAGAALCGTAGHPDVVWMGDDGSR